MTTENTINFIAAYADSLDRSVESFADTAKRAAIRAEDEARRIAERIDHGHISSAEDMGAHLARIAMDIVREANRARAAGEQARMLRNILKTIIDDGVEASPKTIDDPNATLLEALRTMRAVHVLERDDEGKHRKENREMLAEQLRALADHYDAGGEAPDLQRTDEPAPGRTAFSVKGRA